MKDFGSIRQDAGDVMVIAEAGVNHNGSESLAHDLVDVAAASGADYVKFQTFAPDKLVAEATAATPYQAERGATTQSELLAALTLPDDAWARLSEHAHDAGIGFLSTPFDLDSAQLLVDLGVDALKVSSGELTNLAFLTQLSGLGVPMLVSTGMGDEYEVLAAVDACRDASFLALFHCVSAYPAPLDECNLRAIPVLSERSGHVVGWSDHTTGFDSAMIAASLGARLFEKHFTLDRTMTGPDHAASLERDELTAYVAMLKAMPSILGDGRKRRMPSEEPNAPLVRRSWHAVRDLAPGHVLTDADLIALRPESGVSAARDIIGKAVSRPVVAGAPVLPADLGTGS